ncbi:MAG TPA: DUF1361 domain-containing protein [Bacteroidetes bacterium]|nr:DUF1361 domain-containing protein [Bacteroidota bacterium]
MLNNFKNIFADQKQYHLFLLLCLTSLLDFALIAYRIYFVGFDIGQIDSVRDVANTRSLTYMFLVWNLFLAWIPYFISLTLDYFPSKWLAAPALAIWLVFLPNAPYLVTDLLHVGYHPPVPMWYDMMILFSFAWTGLMLGFISLVDVQKYLEKNTTKKVANILTWTAIGLCSFGVYLGRYQRWNTWDIIAQPYQLFMEILAVVTHPLAYLGSLGLAVVMAGVLSLGFLTVRTLVRE